MITVILEFTRRESSIWSTWFDPEINRYANEYNGFNKVPDLVFPTAQTYHLSLHQKSIFYTKKLIFSKFTRFLQEKNPKCRPFFFQNSLKSTIFFCDFFPEIRLFSLQNAKKIPVILNKNKYVKTKTFDFENNAFFFEKKRFPHF